MSLTIEVVQDAARFAEMRGEWGEVLRDSSSNCLFLTWEWLHSWWNHLHSKRQLHIVAIRSAGSLVAIAPLMVSTRDLMAMKPFRALEFIGSGKVGSDYLDIIVRTGWEGQSFQTLHRYFREARLTLRLERLREGCNRVQEFVSGLSSDAWTIKETKAWICPYIDISGQTWPSYLAGLGSEHRYNFNRRLRALSKNFDFRFDRALSESARAEALTDLIALHRDRRDQMGDSNAFETQPLVNFHETFSRSALEANWLRLFVMRLDGRPASALYGLSYNRKFYFYQSGFDAFFRKYSVGLVTMGLAIQAAIEEGLDEYDMLEGGESYKSHWAASSRDLVQLEAYPPGVGGQVLSCLSDLRAGAGKLVRRGLALARH
jgi:CelD/BcsL family acetyltransferase involved in cellulose biosynthesis